MSDYRLEEHEIELDAKLCVMGYSIEWVRWGVLTVPELESQLEEYEDAVRQQRADPEAEVDTNTEHYRYKVMYDWLSAQKELSDEMLDKVIWLLRHDPDQAMAGSLNDGLLCERFSLLTDRQFELVSRILNAQGMTDQVARQSAMRLVWTKPWSVETRDRVLADCTGKQQLEVLEHVRDLLSREDVEAFHEQTDSKAVKNSTRQMLNSRRFRES